MKTNNKLSHLSLFLGTITTLVSLDSCNNNANAYFSYMEEIKGNNFSFITLNANKGNDFISLDFDLKNNLKQNLYMDFKAFTCTVNKTTYLIEEASDDTNTEFNKPIYLLSDAAITFTLLYKIDNLDFNDAIITCLLDNDLLEDKEMKIKISNNEFTTGQTGVVSSYYQDYSLTSDKDSPFKTILNKDEIKYSLRAYGVAGNEFTTTLLIVNNGREDYLFTKNEINVFINGYLIKKSNYVFFNSTLDTTSLVERTIPGDSSATLTLNFTTSNEAKNVSFYLGSVVDDNAFVFPDGTFGY